MFLDPILHAKRFGIVHVDYATLAWTPKDSARFYATVVRDNAVPRRGVG